MNDKICPNCKNQLDDCECTPYISPSELDIFATPNKLTRKRVKLIKVDYQPKIDLGIDLNDIPDEDNDFFND
jgi:hypothetical protein